MITSSVARFGSLFVFFLFVINHQPSTILFLFQGPEFRKFILTKLINAEKAALKSAEFSRLAVSIYSSKLLT